jgi:glycosyltransferase involved in cell wall biosynthesis
VRILIVHSRYLSGAASGENRVVEDEATLLKQAGHDVWVFAPEPDASGLVGQFREGKSAIWSGGATDAIDRIVREQGIDVVHAHNLFPTLSPAALRAAASAGAAVVVTLHNFRLMCLPANLLRDGRPCEDCVGHLPWRGVIHRCFRGSALGSAALAGSLGLHRGIRSFDRVTRYLAVSEFVRGKHMLAGIPADRVIVKPNFTWPVDRRSDPGDYFVFVGRLAHEKGVDTLLSAWRVMGSSSPPLLVVGDGPDGASLRADAPPGVEFQGPVPASDVPGILAHARALLVPSRWYEAAPRSIIEAYAAGVPVLASDLGALPEAIVDGVSGRPVAVDDPRAWAEALGRLDDEASAQLGAGALRLWEERYSPERGLEGLESAYRDAIAVDRRSRAGARRR